MTRLGSFTPAIIGLGLVIFEYGRSTLSLEINDHMQRVLDERAWLVSLKCLSDMDGWREGEMDMY